MNKNIKSNNEKESNEEQERQIIEHMPYLSLLLEDVRELNRALREGKSGVTETKNLLTDMPTKWMTGIYLEIQKANDEYNKQVDINNNIQKSHVKQSLKDQSLLNLRNYGQMYSLNIKQQVISILDSKDILLVTKKSLAGKTFRIDAEGIDDE